MAVLTGSSTAEVDAPLEQVWALVEDVERASEWQSGLKGIHALERDDEGHAILCQTCWWWSSRSSPGGGCSGSAPAGPGR